jgi:hypothetical protein
MADTCNTGGTSDAYSTVDNPTQMLGGGVATALGYAVVGKTGSCTVTITFGTSSAGGLVIIHEISGVDTSSPLDAHNVSAGGFGAASTVTATTNFDGDYIFVGASNTGSANYTAGNGFIIPPSGTNGSAFATEYAIQSTHGLITATFNGTKNYANTAIMAFKAAAGSPPPADTTPPSVPAGLTATAVSSTAINLSWTASTDNVGVTGYTIYRGGVQIGTTVNNNYNDNGLTAGTQYSYTVSAYDAAGNNSSQSTAANATTQASAPPPSGNYPWSGFLDPSRAIDWSGAEFTIPNYTVNCPIQPSLTPNDLTAAAANTTAIQNALASCDATHNVVNIPAGTYYVAGWKYGSQGRQVVRGAGPMLTTVIPTSLVACGFWMGICMTPPVPQSHTMAAIPPSGTQQCAWTGGLTQGSTIITLSSCGSGPPPVNAQLILDQANDTADTGGVYNCDPTTDFTYGTHCQNKPPTLGLNADGRVIAGNTHSEQQVVHVTGVTNNGGGTYAVTISRPVYFNNIRSSQSPGAWWVNYVQNDGLENLTVDHAAYHIQVASVAGFTVGNYVHGLTSGGTAQIVGMQQPGGSTPQLNLLFGEGATFLNGETIQEISTRGGTPSGVSTTATANQALNWSAVNPNDCYQCWVKNTRQLNGPRSDIMIVNSLNMVVRDNYFYKAQGAGSQSYGIEVETMSESLIENNIFQQLTVPIMFGQGSGNVVGYNYTIDDIYGNGTDGTWMMLAGYYAHNSGNEMNLWEGNNLDGISCDGSTFGPSALGTIYRNMLIGWQSGKLNGTYPFALENGCRGFNAVGNVIGQPGYHHTYESYATSATAGVNGGSTVNKSIYVLGWSGINGVGGCSGGYWPVCDPIVRPTLMRWGNYDVVTNGTKWNSTEASPAAVPYIGSNFTSGYFDSLTHILPASLYYSSQPSWWPAAKPWPPVGPDVSSGNLGICSGTYAGAQATASGQCAGGTLTTSWAAHANSIPAQDCYLNVMHGPPDGTGDVLNFDANNCYYGGTSDTTPPSPPTGVGVN